jgi:hypothetical protein
MDTREPRQQTAAVDGDGAITLAVVAEVAARSSARCPALPSLAQLRTVRERIAGWSWSSALLKQFDLVEQLVR